MFSNYYRLLPAVLLATGCMGSFGDVNPNADPEVDPRLPENNTNIPTSCPIDPDCAIGGDCSLYECPDYWVCEDQPTNGRKRCTNPGPDFPDDGEWACEDIEGRTVCTGSDFPDDGGGTTWDCETRAEFVVCTNDTPDYPDEGGDGPFNCWFTDEFRICETIPSGDGGGWSCYENAAGEQECRNNNPEFPDDGEWACWDMDGATNCRRPGDFPDDGGGSDWDCESQGEFVVCSDDTPDYPDDGGDGPWDCTFGDEFRVCTPDQPDIPDTGEGECVPGVQRWCDDATYCSWGKQTCLPDGSWGRCIEPIVRQTGLVDRPATECGCRFFYWNEDCCEDQEDRDGDGHPDCMIPTNHEPPACESDGGVCSFCDAHSDCGGPTDMCIFRSDGYAMCGQDCSTTGCPSGYGCFAIGTSSGTVRQCVPQGNSCG